MYLWKKINRWSWYATAVMLFAVVFGVLVQSNTASACLTGVPCGTSQPCQGWECDEDVSGDECKTISGWPEFLEDPYGTDEIVDGGVKMIQIRRSENVPPVS